MSSMREIARRAARAGRTVTFIGTDGRSFERRTWASLLECAARRASVLARAGVVPGSVVLIVDDTGPAIVETVLAVNHLGAVPSLLPQPMWHYGTSRTLFILEVAAHTGAACVLVGEAILAKHEKELSPLGERLQPISSRVPSEFGVPEEVENELAHVQYYSGSTRAPRGIRVSQRCLSGNLDGIHDHVELGEDEVFVSWLPLHHDMGFVAGLFGPPSWEGDGVLMDSSTFIHRPSRWLRAISDHGGTLSASPNFGFEYCLRYTREHELAGIRLDHWRFCWNGAETVLAKTVRAFEHRFARLGLRDNFVTPCYGAAEATLAITSRRPGEPLLVRHIAREALERGLAREALDRESAVEIVSCGRPIPGLTLRILDDSGEPLPEGTVGEIEAAGATIALEGGRFPSGDLGFVEDGELFITGRKKDLIIVDGRNIYPLDLELAAQGVLQDKLRRTVAFSVRDYDAGTEKIIVALELVGKKDLDAGTSEAVRLAVCAAAGTASVQVCVLDSIPTTSSGKIQRGRAKELWMAGACQPSLRREVGLP